MYTEESSSEIVIVDHKDLPEYGVSVRILSGEIIKKIYSDYKGAVIKNSKKI